MLRVALVLLPIALAVPALADDAIQFTDHPDNDRYPAWSPDGTTIAYGRDNGNQGSIYRKDVEGGTAIPFINNTNAMQPAWDHDGNGIYWSRLEVLWYRNLGTGSTTQVSSQTDGAKRDEAPAISSSGQIAIQTVFGDEQVFSIAYFDRPGGVTQRLTSEAGRRRWPSWNPAGDQIVFEADGDIHTIPLSGGSEISLVTDPAQDTEPDWSPDGNWIAFTSFRSGNNDIWLIPASGGNAIQVTDNPGNDSHPDWSPDGTRIAFESDRAGNPDIWIIDVSSVFVEPTSWGRLKQRFE